MHKTLVSILSIVFIGAQLTQAQGLKNVFGPSKKDLMLRIDSMSTKNKAQAEKYQSLIQQLEQKIALNQQQINTLVKKNKQLSLRVDTLMIQRSEVNLKEEVDTSSTHLSTFCPDSLNVIKIQELQECQCFKNGLEGPTVSPLGMKIVETGIALVADKQLLVKGSCWNYINTVYNEAGFPSTSRETVYSAKKGTLLKNLDLVQPGDWIYHVNHSFRNVEHSAIFICWKDFDKKIGITLGHVGQNKLRTGQFGEYDLKSIYNIIRPKNNE